MNIDPAGLTATETYKLMSGAIVPRPIAWISTVSQNGVYNLAPFSFFTVLCSKPPMVCVSIGRRNGVKKDTTRNAEWARDFVINVVDEGLAEKMNQTSGDYPPEESEFDVARLTPVPGDQVKSPRVNEAPISMECRLAQTLEFGDQADHHMDVLIGEVVKIHVRDDLYYDGKIDLARLKAVGRLAGDLYCTTTDTFAIQRPRQP